MKITTTLLFALFVAIISSHAQTFQWAKSMGGGTGDNGESIAVDGSGNVYTTGSFHGTADFDPGQGTYNLTSTGGQDIFILKLDAAGNFLWAKRMGGTSADWSSSIALDGSDNVYITGYFRGTVDFDPGVGTYNLTTMGEEDIFISKLDSAGNFIWAKRIGGAFLDYSRSIAVDGSGNVYTTGGFIGTVDFDPGVGTYNLTSAGIGDIFGDIFIIKLDSSGNFIWAKRLGGNSSDIGISVTVDVSGNVYTTGGFSGSADFDPGPGTSILVSNGGWEDIFISKLDAAGNFLWAKSMGGTYDDYGYSIAVDASGNVYTTGHFTGNVDFDPGAGISNLTGAGGEDIFILKLDAAGNFLWAKKMGGTSNEIGRSLAVDGSGNVYITGNFQGTADFDPGAGTSYLTSAGVEDIFVSKLDAAGNFSWAISMGGTSEDNARSIAVDGSGNVYFTGGFSGTVDFDPGAGTNNLTSVGGRDVFISKYNSCGISDLNTSLSGETITAHNTSATYQWLDCGNNYAAIAGATGQTFTATANGNYAVELTENGCVDTSACVAITTVGILENSYGNALRIYPNPTQGELSIDLGTSHDEVTVIIRNLLGQEVLRKSFGGSSVLQINIPGEAGTYLIELSSGDKKAVVKVVKE